MIAEKVVVAGASHDRSLGLGMLCYEDGTWVLATFGVARAKPPTTFAGMLALADELLPAHFSTALARAEPLGDPAFHAFPASRWRRYDKLDRFPAGIVPFGDAAASFNPTFGQGMTMTSLQAGNVRRALQAPDDELAAKLNRATARTTYPVWMMNAIGDVAFHHADAGPIPWWWRPSGALFDQFLGAAETEPVLAEWFLQPVFTARQPLYGPTPADSRPRHRAQHAAVAR
jgi:2-polyprenyl-6-methoxyphenol hydroxylase-like FAD-dependent oxidoreductase